MTTVYSSEQDAIIAILETLTQMVRYHFGIASVKVNFSDKIFDLGEEVEADSLDQVEFLMALEDEYGIEIKDEDAARFKTIADVVNYLLSNAVAVKAPAPKIKPAASSFKPVISTADFNAPKAAATPAPLTSLPKADDEVGILWMPSLEWHGRVYKVEGVTVAEAIELMNEYATKATAKRKTNVVGTVTADTQHSEFFFNVIDTDMFHSSVLTNVRYYNQDIMSLFESKVPKTRGLRPLFLAKSVIGVGTTVIYNKNWATINFSDDTVLQRLLDIQSKYEVDEGDQDNDDSYDY